MCLQAMWWNFSIGLSLGGGGFKQPQKSLAYKNIGFIRVSSRFSVLVVCGKLLLPIEFFSLKNAFMALSRRSLRALLIPPDGVNRSPRYLTVLLISVRAKCLTEIDKARI